MSPVVSYILLDVGEIGTIIPVITLWQPWATWVMWGWKTIETRLHARFRGLAGRRIGIHAAHKWDTSCFSAAGYMTYVQMRETMDMLTNGTVEHGKLLGTVQVDAARWLNPKDAKRALIECRTRRFGLLLSDPQPFKEPKKLKGAQGIQYVRL